MRALTLSVPTRYDNGSSGFPAFKVGANKPFAWMSVRDYRVEEMARLSAGEREIVGLLPSLETH